MEHYDSKVQSAPKEHDIVPTQQKSWRGPEWKHYWGFQKGEGREKGGGTSRILQEKQSLNLGYSREFYFPFLFSYFPPEMRDEGCARGHKEIMSFTTGRAFLDQRVPHFPDEGTEAQSTGSLTMIPKEEFHCRPSSKPICLTFHLILRLLLQHKWEATLPQHILF